MAGDRRRPPQTHAGEIRDTIGFVIAAGLSTSGRISPYPLYPLDGDGEPWPVAAADMTPTEIIKFIGHRFGQMFADELRKSECLTLH